MCPAFLPVPGGKQKKVKKFFKLSQKCRTNAARSDIMTIVTKKERKGNASFRYLERSPAWGAGAAGRKGGCYDR